MKASLYYLFAALTFFISINECGFSYIYDAGRCLKSGEQPERTVLRSCKLRQTPLVGYFAMLDNECKDTGIKVFCAYDE